MYLIMLWLFLRSCMIRFFTVRHVFVTFFVSVWFVIWPFSDVRPFLCWTAVSSFVFLASYRTINQRFFTEREEGRHCSEKFTSAPHELHAWRHFGRAAISLILPPGSSLFLPWERTPVLAGHMEPKIWLLFFKWVLFVFLSTWSIQSFEPTELKTHRLFKICQLTHCGIATQKPNHISRL